MLAAVSSSAAACSSVREEIVVTAGDLGRPAPDIFTARADRADRLTQAVLHGTQQRHQLSHTVTTKRFNGLAEIALRNLAELLTNSVQRFHQHRHRNGR